MAILEWIQTATRDSVQNAASALGDVSTSTSTSAHPENMASSIPSIRTLSKLAFSGANVLLGQGQRVLGGTLQACANPQLSCHNTTVVENLCCFNAPGGQLLQTQFWDTQPATGPETSWTLHGLW